MRQVLRQVYVSIHFIMTSSLRQVLFLNINDEMEFIILITSQPLCTRRSQYCVLFN